MIDPAMTVNGAAGREKKSKKDEKEKQQSTFDTDADFIPFESSENESVDHPTHSFDELPSSSHAIERDLNGDARKRKRDLESSPERAPPKQRPKTTDVEVNPWQKSIHDYDFSEEPARMLHKEVKDFAQWIAPTKQEIQVRAYVVKRVIEAIEAAFPDCRAYPFGSYNTKLYIPDADIDIVVDRPGHTWGKESMKRLGRVLQRRGVGRSFQYIFGAKVPIIKFVDTYARIDIDLAFNQSNALNVASLVQNYLNQMPALQPLVMILKTLFNQNNLSIPAEGGLGSYSIICLVISFLQRHPKVAAGHILAEENLGAMLLEILELYGTKFNFERVGIAVDNAKGMYFDKISYQRLNPIVWKKICIRDPNDTSNNIAKASHQAEAIVKVFGDAFRELSTRCYLVNARIKEGGKPPWGTSRGSLLDSIIERPSIATRERIRKKWTREMDGLDDRPEEVAEVVAVSSVVATPKKPNRAERRAAQRAAKESVDEQFEKVLSIPPTSSNNPLSPKLVPSAKRSPVKSPGKRKTPTALVSGTTRDTAILLDDTPPTPLTRPQSPKKTRVQKFAISAAENLRTSGSISGNSKRAIIID